MHAIDFMNALASIRDAFCPTIYPFLDNYPRIKGFMEYFYEFFFLFATLFFFVSEFAFGVQAATVATGMKVANLSASTFNTTTNVTTNGTNCTQEVEFLHTYLVVFAVLFITHGILSLFIFGWDYVVSGCSLRVMLYMSEENGNESSVCWVMLYLLNMFLMTLAVVGWLIYGIVLVHSESAKVKLCALDAWNTFAFMVQFLLYSLCAFIAVLIIGSCWWTKNKQEEEQRSLVEKDDKV